jgi:hypothetical protein
MNAGLSKYELPDQIQDRTSNSSKHLKYSVLSCAKLLILIKYKGIVGSSRVNVSEDTIQRFLGRKQTFAESVGRKHFSGYFIF